MGTRSLLAKVLPFRKEVEVLRPDLVAPVLAVVDQGLWHQHEGAVDGCQHREPLVVQPTVWNRQGAPREVASHHCRRTGHEVASQQHSQSVAALQ